MQRAKRLEGMAVSRAGVFDSPGCRLDCPVIRIALRRTEAGAIVGEMTIDDAVWAIATWLQGGDPGHVNATTDEGHQVTIALGDRAADGTRDGAITVDQAPWTLTGCRFDGMVMTGVATLPPADEGLKWLFPGVFE